MPGKNWEPCAPKLYQARLAPGGVRQGSWNIP